MLPAIFTLPASDGNSVPVGSVRGLAHLIVVSLVILVTIVATTILTLFHDSVPDFFPIIAISGLTYIVGVNIGAASR